MKTTFRYYGADKRCLLIDEDQTSYTLHCGDGLKLMDGKGNTIQARLEHDEHDWYLAGMFPAHAAWWNNSEVFDA